VADDLTRIHLCGRLTVEWAGERLERALPGRQGRLLFAYLVLQRGRPVRRDELIDALWSEDGPPPSGDALLAPPLSRLRKALGPGRLEGRGELTLALPPDAWVDWEVVHDELARTRERLQAGEWAGALAGASAALAIADRGLLPGLEATWIDERRRELGELRLEALEAVAAAGMRLGGADLATAEQAARAAVEAAPFRESARAVLIETLAATGNTAEALRAYEDVRVLLREELGTSPGPALVALHTRLLNADAAPAPPSAPGPAAPPAPSSAAASPAPRTALPDRLDQAVAAALVGRTAALERLREELEGARAGDARLVLVAGEGGIGKTRLVAELAAVAEGVTVLYGRCDEEELVPFGPWIEVLSVYLASLDDAAVTAVVGDAGAELTRLVPELRARLPGLDAPPAADPETERHRLFAAVVGVVERAAARTPLLLVIDDLHWADRSSLLLLRQLVSAPRLGPVLLVGTLRDNELAPGHALVEALATMEREQPLARLRLEGLDQDEVGALVGAWHGRDAPEETIRAIHGETNGNPFFVKQLVRHLEESGTAGGPLPAQDFGVPAGLRDVIVSRVARLPPQASSVLSVAALIGRDFDLGLLEAVMDLGEDELLDCLDASVRAGMLVEIASTPGRYSFVHALLRTSLERDLTATRRARLHRRIGEEIEQRHRDRLDPHLVDLVRHFAAAGPEEVDRAVAYGLQAADQATARLAYKEAVDLVGAALAARERDDPVDDGDRARLLHRLAVARWRAGMWKEARETFVQAMEAARAAGAVTLFARAALGHTGGSWASYGTEDRESVRLLEEALEQLDDGDSVLRAEILARLGELLYYGGDSEERVPAIVSAAVDMARRLGDATALIAALSASMFAHWRPDELDARLDVSHELVELCEASGGGAATARAYAWRAIALLESCWADRAFADIARHAELTDQVQQAELINHRAAFAAMGDLLAGRFDTAEQTVENVLTVGKRATATDALQSYGVEMIALRNEQLRLGELVPHFEMLGDAIEALPGWRTAIGWGYLQAGRVDEARAQVAAVHRDDFALLPRDANFIPALTILAHMAPELDDLELAGDLERALRPYAERWVVLGAGSATIGPVAWALGAVGLLLGETERAAADFAAGLAYSRALGSRPYEAHCALGLAIALERRGEPGDAERAEGLRASAVETAHALGMARLLRDAGIASRA